MSSQLPPDPNVNFFNNEYWINEATPLTEEIANTLYLKFPVAQGAEDLLDVNVIGNATFQNTLSIANGVNTSTLDMSGTDLVIDNNVNSGSLALNVKNGSGVVDTKLVISTTNAVRGYGGGLAFSAQNTGGGLQFGILRMGVGSASLYNSIVQANDSAIVGTSTTGTNNGALVLTCESNIANSGGIRITQPTINMRGDNIQLNANTNGGLTSTTPQPASSDSSTKIPTTAWVQSAIVALSAIPFYQFTGTYVGAGASALPIRASTIQFNFTGSSWTTEILYN